MLRTAFQEKKPPDSVVLQIRAPSPSQAFEEKRLGQWQRSGLLFRHGIGMVVLWAFSLVLLAVPLVWLWKTVGGLMLAFTK